MIMSHTVVLPEAVPPETPTQLIEAKKIKIRLQKLNQMLSEIELQRVRDRERVPMTKGCLGAAESARFEESAAEARSERGEAGEEEGGGEEDKRPSSRRPEKWGPEALSMR